MPPKKPIIHDANGRKMVSVLGPYKIGEKLIATCISSAGKMNLRYDFFKKNDKCNFMYIRTYLRNNS